MPTSNPHFRLPKHIAFVTHGERTVLLDIRASRYYSLNEVGGAIWSMLGDGLSVEEIIETLTVKYDVTRQRAADDVSQLVDALTRHALVEPAIVT
ncbi:MAG TPA: PqqD family protein [Gemmatimonadaceae bacterium]|nr:PqqD family protein [Gemmatimonadaceae bacterium]